MREAFAADKLIIIGEKDGEQFISAEYWKDQTDRAAFVIDICKLVTTALAQTAGNMPAGADEEFVLAVAEQLASDLAFIRKREADNEDL
tara:strand:+ start:98 stop:364 length:267 start_codon:yes stop_codon:yes gene_type:complete